MEQKRTTQIWRLIQQYMDGQVVEVKQAAIANAIGVGRSTLSQWKFGQTRPTPANLRKLHEVTRIPYQTFLDALLVDMGYLDTEAGDDGGDAASNSRGGSAPAEKKQYPSGRAATPTRKKEGRRVTGSRSTAGNGRITLLPDP